MPTYCPTTSKRCYPDREAAAAEAAQSPRKPGMARARATGCIYCGQFHVAHATTRRAPGRKSFPLRVRLDHGPHGKPKPRS